ncbi:MAG: 4-amino-4-deoxy-L-arabinose transferase, partial [Cyanobacteria bacterium P01_A01_bin.105]
TLAIASLTPLFTFAFGTLTAPDSGLIFCGTLAVFWASQEFFPAASDPRVDVQPITPGSYRPTYRITLISVALGLACISKYHGFLLGLGLVLFCLSHRSYRRALISPWLGLGLVLFAITLFPLWWWGWQTDWLSFQFHLGLRFESEAANRFSLLQLLGVFGVGLAYLFPSIGLPLWWASLKSLSARAPRQALLLWVGLPMAAGFTLLGGMKHIFPAWPAPGLWWLTPLLGYYAAQWPQRRVQRWIRLSGWTIATLLTIAFLHVTLGLFQKGSPYAPLGGFIAPRQDPINELIDTVQLQQRLQADPTLAQPLANADFVFTNEFFLGGYFGMALHDVTHAPVTSLTQDPRGFAQWFNPAEQVGNNAVYITPEREHTADITDSFRPYFTQFRFLGSVSTTRQGIVTNTFYLYEGIDMRQAYPYPY